MRAALGPVLARRGNRDDIGRLRRVLLGPAHADIRFGVGPPVPPIGVVDDDLAALIANVLTDEPVGTSCDELARRLHRRRIEVLRTLRSDGRFVHRGDRRGSRWRLAVTAPTGSRDGRGRTDGVWGGVLTARPSGDDSEAA